MGNNKVSIDALLEHINKVKNNKNLPAKNVIMSIEIMLLECKEGFRDEELIEDNTHIPHKKEEK